MGIDIYLQWPKQTKTERAKQMCGFSTVNGNAGYLREAYHGGPYATQILCREAFEAENGEAAIPAAVLRERLTGVTEPARRTESGHDVNAGHRLAEVLLGEFAKMGMESVGATIKAAITPPQTVEEAVRERYRVVYPGTSPEQVEAVVQSFRDFVTLAEQKERETGEPCTIIASY